MEFFWVHASWRRIVLHPQLHVTLDWLGGGGAAVPGGDSTQIRPEAFLPAAAVHF
jgi:hypothetical protein